MTVTVDERLMLVDEIAQEIRRVDGDNRMNAGKLAEEISAFLAAELLAARKEIASLRDGLSGTRPYVLNVVNNGGIKNCEIGDRLELEWIDKLLAGGNSNE